MMDAKVGEPRSFLEEIGLHIPGFKGYLRKEHRRDADRAQRDYLAAQLKRTKERVDGVKRDLAQKGELDSLTKLDALTDKFSRAITRVSSADYGYSGFFDTHQVGESALAELYQVDLALIEEARKLDELTAPLAAGQPPADFAATLARVEDGVIHFDGQFDKRKQILKGAM
jgi:hypothetical protein